MCSNRTWSCGRRRARFEQSQVTRRQDLRWYECSTSLPQLQYLMGTTSTVLCQFTCQNSEEITAIHMIPFSEGNTAICVGTVFFKPNEQEPSQGRLLLITAESDATTGRQLKKNSEMSINGCVYALTRVNGLLAASIGPSVSVRLLQFCLIRSCFRFLYTKSTPRVFRQSHIGTTTTL